MGSSRNRIWNIFNSWVMMVYLGVIIGSVVYMFLDFIGEVGKKVFAKKYLSILVGNIVAGFALVWAFDLQKGFSIGGIEAARIVSMFFGIAGQKLLKTIMAITDKKVKTTIGINESNK